MLFRSHVGNISVERSLEKIRNVAIVYDDGSYSEHKQLRYYANPSSTAEYDRRVERISDNRVGATVDVQKLGQRFIDEHQKPGVKIVIEILDNNLSSVYGYDIESIHPGDTCSFFGLDESLADIFEENMMITKVEYTLEKAVITVEPFEAGIINRQEKINDRVVDLEKEGVPDEFKR